LTPFARQAVRLVWPEGVVTALGLGVIGWPRTYAAAQPFLPFFPAVVLAGGLLVGLRFERARPLFGLLTLVAADRALALLEDGTGPGTRAAILLVAMLLALDLTVLGRLPERGLFGAFGRWWLVVMGWQVVMVLVVKRFATSRAVELLTLPLFPVELGGITRLPQLAVLVFVAGASVLGVRARDPAARGLLWATVASLAAFSLPIGGRTLCFSVAGLALVVSLVETSYSLAFHDELTGLPGRRAFNQALAELGDRYVVAMADVDHFKKFNDQHGHDVGDQVLRLVAAQLAAVGGGGRAFRYGGEEFAVVFPGSSLEAARPHLESLREAVESATFTLRKSGRPRRPPKEPKRGRSPRTRDLSVTVSIGAASPGSHPMTTTAVTEAADKALYRAKAAGRNRVMEES
jgi:GGDEF domain-containing protein